MAARRKGKTAKKTNNDCKNLLQLFDHIEVIHQEIFADVQRGLAINNDEAAIKRILYKIKGRLA